MAKAAKEVKRGRGRPKGTGKRLNGRGCRTKGHEFERWTAEQFRKIYPEARRHLEYQMGEALGRDIANVGPYLVQCKRGKRYSSLSAIQEVQIDPIDGGIPVLVTKGDHTEALACLPFTAFLKLVAYYEKHRKG